MENPFLELKALLEQLLASVNKLQLQPAQAKEEKPMLIDEAADFLRISKSALYDNIGKVPHNKRFGRLYFFKSELLDYLKTGPSVTERPAKDSILQSRRTGGRKAGK